MFGCVGGHEVKICSSLFSVHSKPLRFGCARCYENSLSNTPPLIFYNSPCPKKRKREEKKKRSLDSFQNGLKSKQKVVYVMCKNIFLKIDMVSQKSPYQEENNTF